MKPPFRITVVECDDTTPEDRHHGGYKGWFEALLKAGASSLGHIDPEKDLKVTGFNIVKDPEHYPDDDDIDAILLSGSKYNSYDNDPWIVKLVEYVQRILKHDRIRVIGVCFGHQIIGRALGAKVGRCELGWEVSVTLMKASAKGQDLFKKDVLSLMQMHRDVVYDFPEGVEPLCSTPKCKVHGMYIKRKMISVQGHPEFDGKAMNWLLDTRHKQGLFDDEIYNEAKSRAGNQHDGVLVAEAFLRFMLED